MRSSGCGWKAHAITPMIIGITLFVRLAQALVRPTKGALPLPAMGASASRSRCALLQGLRGGCGDPGRVRRFPALFTLDPRQRSDM